MIQQLLWFSKVPEQMLKFHWLHSKHAFKIKQDTLFNRHWFKYVLKCFLDLGLHTWGYLWGAEQGMTSRWMDEEKVSVIKVNSQPLSGSRGQLKAETPLQENRTDSESQRGFSVFDLHMLSPEPWEKEYLGGERDAGREPGQARVFPQKFLARVLCVTVQFFFSSSMFVLLCLLLPWSPLCSDPGLHSYDPQIPTDMLLVPPSPW